VAIGRRDDVHNPVLRGDLRARFGSHKLHLFQVFSLGVLGLLAFLGLPPELNRLDRADQTSLVVALLVVQVVLVTYLAAACAIQEIAVEGEKPAIDLIFGPFTRSAIVIGKSLGSLITIAYWLLQGAPLLVLAAGIRQYPIVDLFPPLALSAAIAWGVAQLALLASVTAEGDISREIAHWGAFFVIFVATLAHPAVSWANPVLAVVSAAQGSTSGLTAAAYAGLGVVCNSLTLVVLRRFTPA
jgi:ABC-type transport system involved in multi-copper enzyme maturation permease subunit